MRGGGCLCVHMQGLYGGDKVGWRSRRPSADDGKHEEDDHQTGIGKVKRNSRDSSGKTGRNGGEGEVRTRDDTRATAGQKKTGMERRQQNEVRQRGTLI